MERRTVRVAAAAGIAVALAVGGTALGLAATNGAGSAAVGSTEGTGSCAGSAPKLTVQGTGQASGTPDVLTLAVGTDVTDSGAQASLVDDDDKAAAVTAALEHGGVAAKDVQTTDVSVQPRYGPTGTITGYETTNTITAKLRNLSTAGTVVDAVAGAAGNAARIDALTFSIEDPRKVEDQARTDAVAQAVSHARSMALAAGERLGPVCSLSDDSTSPVNPGFPSDQLSVPGAASAGAVPLEPGTQQATALITLVYALRPAGRA